MQIFLPRMMLMQQSWPLEATGKKVAEDTKSRNCRLKAAVAGDRHISESRDRSKYRGGVATSPASPLKTRWQSGGENPLNEAAAAAPRIASPLIAGRRRENC